MDIETVAPFAAGPASAVIVMLMVLGALYQLTTRQLIPLASKALDRHLAALDELVKSNREDHAQHRQDHQQIILTLQRLDREVTSPGITPQ